MGFSGFSLSLNLTCFFLHLTIDDRNERDKLPLYSPHKAKGKSQIFEEKKIKKKM